MLKCKCLTLHESSFVMSLLRLVFINDKHVIDMMKTSLGDSYTFTEAHVLA